MTPVTQIFLYLSYGILAIAVALLPPRLIGLDSSTSSLIAMFVFFLAWQLHQHYLKRQDEEIRDERLERLEDFARFMRQDLKKTRTELEHVTEIHNGKNQKLMSELAVLQTLVSQAVEKGSELGVTRRNAEAQERRFSGKPAADTHSTVSNDTAPPQGAPSPAPLMASLEDEEMLLSIINQALSENRVDLYMQPIVGLPSRKAKHYECFSRIRDENGSVLEPTDYIQTAENMGLIGTIDNLLLFRLIQHVRSLGPRSPDMRFLCNMSRYSVMDEEFFPQFIDFMATNSEFAERLVFEISQDDYKSMDSDHLERIFALSRHGYQFSLDNVTDMDFDFLHLSRRNFRFIKADVDTLLGMGDDLSVLKAFLGRNSLHLIASHIEEESHVLDTIEQKIDLAQGYIFGKPGPASKNI